MVNKQACSRENFGNEIKIAKYADDVAEVYSVKANQSVSGEGFQRESIYISEEVIRALNIAWEEELPFCTLPCWYFDYSLSGRNSFSDN